MLFQREEFKAAVISNLGSYPGYSTTVKCRFSNSEFLGLKMLSREVLNFFSPTKCIRVLNSIMQAIYSCSSLLQYTSNRKCQVNVVDWIVLSSKATLHRVCMSQNRILKSWLNNGLIKRESKPTNEQSLFPNRKSEQIHFASCLEMSEWKSQQLLVFCYCILLKIVPSHCILLQVSSPRQLEALWNLQKYALQYPGTLCLKQIALSISNRTMNCCLILGQVI